MFKILKKRILNEQVKLMEIDAPLIAKKAAKAIDEYIKQKYIERRVD